MKPFLTRAQRAIGHKVKMDVKKEQRNADREMREATALARKHLEARTRQAQIDELIKKKLLNAFAPTHKLEGQA